MATIADNTRVLSASRGDPVMVWIGMAIFAYCVISFAGAAIISEGVRARYTPLVVTHGLLVMAWIGLVPLQASLAFGSKLRRHRFYGNLSPILVAAMIIVGLPVMVLVYNEFGNKGLLFANIMFFVQFLIFYVPGIFAAKRHRVDWHRRLMLFATLSMLGPAHGRFVRLFGFGDEAGGLIGPLFLIAIPLLYDFLNERRVDRSTLILMGISVLIFVFIVVFAIVVLGATAS